MARRNDHSREELQSMAIDATRSLITKEGLDGVSARKISQQIGYTVGTLYQAFENIHDVILHANAYSLSELLNVVKQAQSSAAPPQQRISQIALAYLKFARTHKNQWSAIFRHRLPPDFVIPDWYQARIDELFSTLESTLRQLGPKRPNKQVQIAARTLWSSVHGICLLYADEKLYSNNIATPEELIISLVSHYTNAWSRENVT